MRQCSSCGTHKPLTDFYRDRLRGVDGFRMSCKACSKAYAAYDYEINREKRLAASKKWQLDNPERVKQRRIEYYEETAELQREKRAAYHKEKPEVQGFTMYAVRVNEPKDKILARYGISKEALWKETRPIYKEAQRLTQETGEQHHVDHIIPVAVGGLHRASNLQVLTEEEHTAKSVEDRALVRELKKLAEQNVSDAELAKET